MFREPIAARLHRLVYDGTNEADIAAELGGGYSLTSDNGSTLQFEYLDVPYSVPANGSILLANGGHVQNCMNAADFADMQMTLPKLVERRGSTAVPAKALGGSNDVTVTLDSAMLTEGYAPDSDLRGAPDLLGQHGITGFTVVDQDTVTVHITSAVGALSGATAHVVAREVV